MGKYRSDFLNVLDQRGFIQDITNPEELDQKAMEGPINAYIGFDCTASSLHAGSLLPIMMLYWLQQTGHKPITLMGGGTTRVGDPSGKDASRQMLSDAEITDNMHGIRQVFSKFLTFGDGPGDAMMVNNADWLDQLNYIDLLRDCGPHFTINRMLTFDSVKLRLDREQPLSFLEFNYMILQAYDFAELHKRYGCILQMGGSDQWGNIINGVELGRRRDGANLFGLTSPLLTTSSGAKMGKTAEGAIWLNAEMLKPYDYWQFWRNTDDADTGRFLKLFTALPLEEIARLEALQGAEINEAKKILATRATALLHGPQAAEAAQQTAHQAFVEGEAAAGLPSIEVAGSELAQGTGLLALLVQAGLAKSNGEARRSIKGGAIKLNDSNIGDEAYHVSLEDVNAEGVIKLSMGKKRHVLVRPI